MGETKLTDAQLIGLLNDKRALITLQKAVELGTLDRNLMKPVPTREAAEAYTDMVIRQVQKTDRPDTYAQKPYTIEDLGDSWRVRGSGSERPFFGTVIVVISKASGALVSYGTTWKDGTPAMAPSLKSQ